MRTYLFIIRCTVLAASLTLIPWVAALSTQAAELSPGAGIPEFMGVQGAADEVANFARMVMPVEQYGIFFPRSGPEEYGTTVPRSWSEHSKEIYSAPSDRPFMPSLPYFPSLGRDE